MILEELTGGLSDWKEFGRLSFRLLAAAVLGALVGLQREMVGKPAGLRTHMLVCIGTALFILAISAVEFQQDAQSRVIQGIVTGIGFMGAGSILKLSHEREIHGLTTAAGVWVTAAIGTAVGLGVTGLAIVGTLVTLVVLSVLQRFDQSKTGG